MLKPEPQDELSFAFGRADLQSFYDLIMDMIQKLEDQHRRFSYSVYEKERELKNRIIKMDKKMHKVTERMKMAERDIKKGKAKQAVKVLKGAEKKNEKLVKIDREVRDPMIEKCKKSMHKKK